MNVYNDFGMDNYCLYCTGMYRYVFKKMKTEPAIPLAKKY
ncbi:hypothetical protein A1D15_0340 [Lactiplantibacillus plantarum]|nr:hypothetical protein A1D15_0340 [Lactiplantibacillus plantarum]